MTRVRQMRVLVVEDDPNWREGLCRMYQQLLAPSSPAVESAGSGPDALRRLRTDRFDLLSLDINLGLTHPRTADGSPDLGISGADGRTVLRRAYEMKACNGVIVVTGLPYDQTLSVVIPDKEEVKRVKMTFGLYLQELFPGRHLYLLKNSEVSECMKIFKHSLSFEQLLQLCEASPGVKPPYTMEFSGSEDTPHILVRSKGNPRDIVSITQANDARFLYWVGKLRNAEPFHVTKQMVCGIYRGRQARELEESLLSRYADTDIYNVRRRLRKQGLSPDDLFVAVRGLGWKLNPDVNLRGFASVNVRSPGFGGKYQGHDMLGDIPDPTSTDPWNRPGYGRASDD